MECRYFADVCLDHCDLVGADPSQPRYAVRVPTTFQLGQAGQLALARGDDQLAAALRLDPVLRAVLVELPRALHAQLRLQRSGRVVDAGVDHAAVPGRLDESDVGLALDQRKR